MHSTKFRFTMHLCYRYKSEYLVCSALTSSSIIILLSSLMEQITGTLTQDTNFNLLYLPCRKICTLSFPLTYVMFTLPGELNFNVYAILCSCVTILCILLMTLAGRVAPSTIQIKFESDCFYYMHD